MIRKHRRSLGGSTGPALALALAVGVGMGVAGAAGCGDRAHLREGHGRSVRAAFSSQAANPEAGRQPHKLPPLDAQEASVVAENYRRSLATKGTEQQDQGLLILAPQSQGKPYLPPPSVPQEKK